MNQPQYKYLKIDISTIEFGENPNFKINLEPALGIFSESSLYPNDPVTKSIQDQNLVSEPRYHQL